MISIDEMVHFLAILKQHGVDELAEIKFSTTLGGHIHVSLTMLYNHFEFVCHNRDSMHGHIHNVVRDIKKMGRLARSL